MVIKRVREIKRIGQQRGRERQRETHTQRERERERMGERERKVAVPGIYLT